MNITAPLKYLHRRPSLRLALVLLAAAPAAPIVTPTPSKAQAPGEETDPAPTSRLSKIALPAGAERMREIPASMRAALAKVASSSGVRLGASEVLAWRGAAYSKSRAPKLLAGIQSALGKSQWQVEPGEAGQPVQLLTAIHPDGRVLLGMWVPADQAAILIWSQVSKGTAPAPQPPAEEAEAKPAAGAITLDLGADARVVNVMGRAAPKIPSFPKLAPKKGFVRGYVKDGAGRPLANTKLGVRSTAVGGAYSGAQGQTDAKGYYEIAVPFGAAHFYNAGYAVSYGDGRVALGLHPADGELSPFASNAGHVENFVLLGHGVADEGEAQEQPQYAGNYHGGAATFDWRVEDERFPTGRDLPARSQIEITFTPQGALLDGSAGKSIVIRKRIGEGFGQLYVVNIPSGTYRLSARLLGGGPLKMKEGGPNFAKPFGLSPKESNGAATFQMRPGTAKADMAVGGRGGWQAIDVSLSR